MSQLSVSDPGSSSSREKLFSVLEILPALVWQQHSPGGPCRANRRWREEMGGASGSEPFVLADTLLREDRATYLALEKRAWAEGAQVEGDIRHPDVRGKIRWLRVQMVRRTLPGQRDPFVIGWAFDRTAEQHAQRDLSAKQKAAAESEQFKTRFLANLSHELRTPINAILGLLHGLADTGLRPEQQEHLESLETTTHHLLQLIEHILEFSHLESGTVKVETVSFSPVDIVNNVQTMLAGKLAAKSLRLGCRVAPEVPGVLVGDALRLGQILTNLTDNAVKFSEQGRLLLLLTALPDPREGKLIRLECAVADEGIGLPPEVQTSIFKPFHQVDDSLARKHGGTGLGLAICRELSQLLGGEITVRSEPGRGALFTLNLSLRPSSEVLPRENSPSDPVPLALVLSPDDARRELLATVLRAEHCPVSSVPSWEEARLAFAASTPPAVLVVDRSLLDSHLGTYRERLRGYGFAHTPPTVIVSGQGPRRVTERLRGEGIVAVLPEDFCPAELAEIIHLAQAGKSWDPPREEPRDDPMVEEAPPALTGPSSRILLWVDSGAGESTLLHELEKLFPGTRKVSQRKEWEEALRTMHFDAGFILAPGAYESIRRLPSVQADNRPGILVYADAHDWSPIEKIPLHADGFADQIALATTGEVLREKCLNWNLIPETIDLPETGTVKVPPAADPLTAPPGWDVASRHWRELARTGQWLRLTGELVKASEKETNTPVQRHLLRKMHYAAGSGMAFAFAQWLRDWAESGAN